MTKRMLIDATHAEETRVVVLEGNRLEDFDVETASRRQLKGNIYLAKVVRVEPSLQAAFIEYGGNRHGFLAFGEIHPDYYQIPVADRQRLLELQEEEARAAEQEEDDDDASVSDAGVDDAAGPDSEFDKTSIQNAGVDDADAGRALRAAPDVVYGDEAANGPVGEGSDAEPGEHARDASGIMADEATGSRSDAVSGHISDAGASDYSGGAAGDGADAGSHDSASAPEFGPDHTALGGHAASGAEDHAEVTADWGADTAPELAEPAGGLHAANGAVASEPGDDASLGTRVQHVADESGPAPETVGGSGNTEETREPRMPSRYLRNYKIQEVIRRRQILLVQVVKEERGTKGAAITTYISLAGRFCVLMPNSPRGGGISRKITSAADRRRLKEVTQELEIPRGMGLIVRTAGAARPKPEIKRDCEYLLRLWDDIREHTMQSVAPSLIYEEANLIKRAIRDVYSRDVDEVLIDGEEGWKAARDFMRMLMPTHVKKVQLWRDGGAPLFAKQQVEAQLDAMMVPTVQLRSGGYLVIDQTEALVAIDVNSGRATRERGIEETALRTNLEAADEVARQLRLRDLAGLIVIDFIDMESKKHNAAVERRLKDALREDRARIQIGSISHFGLMEMSRQRLRPSLAETSQSACPHCGGTGHVRSTDSAALHVLRAIEDEGSKRRASEIMVHVEGGVAMFILNNKRVRLMEIEQRTAMRVAFSADDSLLPGQTRIDRLRAYTAQDDGSASPGTSPTSSPTISQTISQTGARMEAFDAELVAPGTRPAMVPETADEDDEIGDDADEAAADAAEAGAEGAIGTEETAEDAQKRRRKRRRRRGGRREDGAQAGAAPMPQDAEQPDLGEPAIAGAAIPGVVQDDATAAQDEADADDATPVPGHDEAGEAAAEQARPRSRSRRGGRRRSKPEGEPEAAPATARYAGPTPADPFSNVADIFDMLEQSELPVTASAPQPPPVERQSGASETDAAALPPAPLLSEAVAPADPADIAANAEPVVGPAIQPVVIGADSVTAERKRGWWRR